ncbi:hypothetical protein GCM10023340_18830 [Nocardioides marinquilinus]|uniref:Uncharacterized protein n=1 Tax=Nocardioides marinquilinus TaxID=1210400 RepID=A0ABP9PKT0_9ACTN
MVIEVSVSDERAQARTVTVLKALGHEAAAGPRRAGRPTVVVAAVREDDLAMIHRVVAAVDRPVVAAPAAGLTAVAAAPAA